MSDVQSLLADAPGTPGVPGVPGAPGAPGVPRVLGARVAEPVLRDFTDPLATRKAIYDKVFASASSLPAVENAKYSLRISNVAWADPEDVPLVEQKQAVLGGTSLARRLRGTVSLIDKATGAPVDEKTTTLAHVPYYSPRGTFVLSGVEHVMSTQARLRAGVYTRRRENGETTCHVNALPGKGSSHHYYLDPSTGVFKMEMHGSTVPLLSILRTMGATSDEIEAAWGKELYRQNLPHDDPRATAKLYRKLVRKPNPGASPAEQERIVREKLMDTGLDPEVTSRTLGAPYDRLTKDTVLAATRKLLAVSRGEAPQDDRDHLAFQHFLGPEDLLSEPLVKDTGILRNLLYKSTYHNRLKGLAPGLLSPVIEGTIRDSGLGNPSEEVNALDMFDAQSRMSRMGRGGLSSVDSIPLSSRMVHPSHLGFLDPTRTSESLKVGVDLRFTRRAKKGADGKVYAPFVDPRTAKEVYRSPQDVADLVVAFPGAIESQKPVVPALVNGSIEMVPKDRVDLVLPYMEDAFSPISNMVPVKSMSRGQRVSMGSRFLIQALPLKEPEAPLVRGLVPGTGGKSWEEVNGRHAGAVFSRGHGKVVKVEPGSIVVAYDGEKSRHEHELYDHFPYARKTLTHNTPTVRPGDRVSPGQLLATSNYTDDKGHVAIGKNLRVAYTSYVGPGGEADYEDAFVISESAARKLTSEHAYQHDHVWEDYHKKGKRDFVSIFPSVYGRDKLATLDDDGAVLPGTEVRHGDPLLLVAKRRDPSHRQVHAGHKGSWSDQSLVWDHHEPGVVTDVHKTDKGVNVVVKSYAQMREGDKMASFWGDKGVVRVVADEHMPQDQEGRPFEVLVNPLGVISRRNPSQVAVTVLGKIAAKTGKRYDLEDFDPRVEDRTAWALEEARRHGVSDLETIVDPVTGRKIPNVLTGVRYYMKLHHQSSSKGSARGLGAYTADEQPARGAGEGRQSKRIAVQDVTALLAHGALSVLADDKLVRGNQNLEYWSAFMAGNRPSTPPVPFVYDKFVEQLRGAGIDVVRDGPRSHLMALTDKRVQELAGDRELRNAETVDWRDGLKPVKGGLFDPGLTGGHGSRGSWAKITLHEPLPNPVMAEPIRRLLGLTQKRYDDVLAGREPLGEKTGPFAIANALARIDVAKELERARVDVASNRKGRRDEAIRKFGFLKACERTGIHPRDWVLSAVPVLPPAFRPVSVMQGGGQLISDANVLYKDLFDANQALKDLSGRVDDVADARLGLYRALEAVVGLGDPVNPRSVEKQVQGLLKQVLGSSPKYSVVQRQLIGTPVNTVGRGVIVPNANLSMDEVGMPENQAWKTYSPFVVRNLVRRGVDRMEALEALEKRSPQARTALLEEMRASPVLVTRAPVLHKYGHMALWPRLVRGDSIHLPPPVYKAYGADNDGDTVNVHVPVGEEARREAAAKMLPSRNLIAISDFESPMFGPSQEIQAGLYELTRSPSEKRPRVFATMADLKKAWARGELDPRDPVEVVDHRG